MTGYELFEARVRDTYQRHANPARLVDEPNPGSADWEAATSWDDQPTAGHESTTVSDSAVGEATQF